MPATRPLISAMILCVVVAQVVREGFAEEPRQRPQLQLINGSEHSAAVFWLKNDTERVASGTIDPGGETTITTTIGHRFLISSPASGREVQVESRQLIQAVRFDFEDSDGIPAWYRQRADADGYPIVASGEVNPYALREAASLINLMLANRPDVRRAMIASRSRSSPAPLCGGR